MDQRGALIMAGVVFPAPAASGTPPSDLRHLEILHRRNATAGLRTARSSDTANGEAAGNQIDFRALLEMITARVIR